MRKEIAGAELLIAEIARNQHGVISFAQLIGAGPSPPSIDRRVKAGRLHRLYRGVYAVGHTNLSWKGRCMAAVLACGPGAVLSHASAAHLWSLSPTSPPFFDVTVPSTAGRAKRKGIVLHRSTTLTEADTTRRDNIPVTTLARTKEDMGWTDATTRSDLERHFLRLLRSHELPLPEVNQRIGPYEVDFLWRDAKLVVELDGYAYHSTRAAFTADRARDRYLTSRGFTVLRFADEEVEAAPDALRSRL
jgi:very-short-patch-repair endonuclease